MFAVLRAGMLTPEITDPVYPVGVVCLNIEQKHDMHFIQHGAVAKIKQGD